MNNKTGKPKFKFDSRIKLWILVAVYTFLLPYFLLIYRAILNQYGEEIVGRVPLLIVAIFGIVYILAVLYIRKNMKYLLFLIPCATITFLIMHLEANPNKHIHIPEYVLMAWLLFAVLSRDYQGRGIFVLIFIYASLLGIIDEQEQGIHPSRFYGWSDMLVNSSSSLIGIFTILGLIKVKTGNWAWTGQLKAFKHLIWLNLFGLIGAGLMCVHLFKVQADDEFWGIYPSWLWIWNLLFIIMVPLVIFVDRVNLRKYLYKTEGKEFMDMTGEVKTAKLWVYPLTWILFYMHTLLIVLSVTGVEFR